MQLLASQFKNLPVISLRNGAIVAHAGDMIIDPSTLELIALYVKFAGWRSKPAVLMTRDIREIAREGMVVDSLEDIEDVSEIVRLKDIIDQKFSIFGLKVVSESGMNLGHITDVSVDIESFRLQKLYVKPSLLQNLLLNELVIDRNQIINVTAKAITVRDATVRKPKMRVAPSPAPTD